MSRTEALNTRIGEILDLRDCDAIAHGASVKGGELGFDEILEKVR